MSMRCVTRGEGEQTEETGRERLLALSLEVTNRNVRAGRRRFQHTSTLSMEPKPATGIVTRPDSSIINGCAEIGKIGIAAFSPQTKVKEKHIFEPFPLAFTLVSIQQISMDSTADSYANKWMVSWIFKRSFFGPNQMRLHLIWSYIPSFLPEWYGF